MVHAQVVEKWVLWPQGMQWKREFYGPRALDERKQNSIRLCMITHTYNCALSTCTHILGKVHFMCIHDKIKDGKCLALKQEPVILIRLIMTLLESSSTLAYLAKEKKKLTNIISFCIWIIFWCACILYSVFGRIRFLPSQVRRIKSNIHNQFSPNIINAKIYVNSINLGFTRYRIWRDSGICQLFAILS